MKWLLLLLPIFTFSQGNFKNENNKLIWEKVYTKTDTLSVNALKKNITLQFTDALSGKSVDNHTNCDGAFYFVNHYPLEFSFSIEEKADKYKVVVHNIQYKTNIETTVYGVTSKYENLPLQDYLLKKNGSFKTGKQTDISSKCIDAYLTDIFTIKPAKEW
jgi:hypothetical protein